MHNTIDLFYPLTPSLEKRTMKPKHLIPKQGRLIVEWGAFIGFTRHAAPLCHSGSWQRRGRLVSIPTWYSRGL
jgi:hypothetical protein